MNDESQKHIPELDGVRGLAILLVTIYRFSREIPHDTPLGFLLHQGLALGEKGVELFFVLSGFLITRVLLAAKGKPHCLRNFYARRSLRIFPLYFGALLFLLVILPWIIGRDTPFEQATNQQFYLWTYLTNIRMSWLDQWCFGRLDHFWSLAVEEHFYLIWPFIILFAPKPSWMPIAIIGLVLSASSRMTFAAISGYGVAPDVLSLFRFDALLCGAILALYAQRQPASRWPLKRWLWITLALFALSMMASLVNRRLFTVAETLWPVAFATAMAGLLFSPNEHLQYDPRWTGFFRLPIMRSLGKYSYAMYVFQSPLIAIVPLLPLPVAWFTLLGGSDSIPAHLAYLLGMFILTYGLAFCSWHLYEKHFLELKSYF